MNAQLTGADPFEIELERFSGPLDLLLHLIRTQNIDIFDIPIARITEQFLAAIQKVERLELERAGEFLELAAVLVRIKVQMLFPSRPTEDEEDPRVDLVRRLLEYEHFREAAHHLDLFEEQRARQWSKGYIEPRPIPRLDAAPLESGWEDLWRAALRLSDRHEAAEEPTYLYTARSVRMDETLDLLLVTLDRLRRVEFSALIAPLGSRTHAVVSLLACLELARRHVLTLRQSNPFGPLWLFRVESSGQ